MSTLFTLPHDILKIIIDLSSLNDVTSIYQTCKSGGEMMNKFEIINYVSLKYLDTNTRNFQEFLLMFKLRFLTDETLPKELNKQIMNYKEFDKIFDNDAVINFHEMVVYSARMGDIEGIKFCLCLNNSDKLKRLICYEAMKYGHRHIVEWIVLGGYTTDYGEMLIAVIEGDQTSLFNEMKKLGVESPNVHSYGSKLANVINKAVMNKDMEMFSFLCERFRGIKYLLPQLSIETMIRNNDISNFQTLFENKSFQKHFLHYTLGSEHRNFIQDIVVLITKYNRMDMLRIVYNKIKFDRILIDAIAITAICYTRAQIVIWCLQHESKLYYSIFKFAKERIDCASKNKLLHELEKYTNNFDYLIKPSYVEQLHDLLKRTIMDEVEYWWCFLPRDYPCISINEFKLSIT
jgi:hypothetical protein